jgi:hypothetical protein
MKIGYIFSAYFGKRRFAHSKLQSDNLFYVKIQLEQISKLNTKLERIYIVCTFDQSVSKDNILSELYQLKRDRDDIIIVPRKNTGGSYCSWDTALKLDDGFCDYMILEEDDYTFGDPNSVIYMLEYFKETLGLFYLCQYWSTKPLKYLQMRFTIQQHAAMSGGMMNNKMYHELRRNGIEFEIEYSSDINYMTKNQMTFLEPYVRNGNHIKEYRKEYSCLFAHHTSNITEEGNKNGIPIFLPIIDKYF